MEDVKYLDLMAKYLSGGIAAGEKAELLAWVGEREDNRAYFDEMLRLWSISGEYEEEDFEVDIPAAWAELDRKLEVKSQAAPELNADKAAGQAKVLRFSALKMLARVAAVVAVIAAGYWWLTRPDEINVLTKLGETRNIELPDGSQVALNQRSGLTYSRKFQGRRVTLSGEAYFDVERMEESPFEIYSGEAKTTVLGTSFNVRAYPDEEEIQVTVQSGRVRLEESSRQENKVELEKGKTGILIRKTKEVKEVEESIDHALAWKTRELAFDQDDIREVAPVLKSVFGVELVISDESIWNCTLEFPKTTNPTLDDIVGYLEWSANLVVYERTDTTIVLGRNEGDEPCK